MSDLIVPPSQELQEEVENSGSTYLPFITILSSRSGKLQEPEYSYIIPFLNKICLVDNGKYICLGDSFDCKYVATRLRATFYENGVFKSAYKEVRTGEDADTYNLWRDRAKANVTGYKFGPEYLVWIPEQQKFGQVFVGTAQTRKRAAVPIMDILDEAAKTGQMPCGIQFYTHKLQGGFVKYPRTIISARRCDDPEVMESNPDEEEAKLAIEQFLNPPNFTEDPGDGR